MTVETSPAGATRDHAVPCMNSRYHPPTFNFSRRCDRCIDVDNEAARERDRLDDNERHADDEVDS